MKLKPIFTAALFVILYKPSYSQEKFADCVALLKEDTLLISNNKIERKWLWNKGNIIPISIKNQVNGKKTVFENSLPAFQLPEKPFKANEDFKTAKVEKNEITGQPAHLELAIINRHADILVKKVYRIFPNTPAISCDTYLKYSVLKNVLKAEAISSGIEKQGKEKPEQPSYTDYYVLDNKHWKIKFVEFQDMTDQQNNLVFEKEVIPYSKRENYRGNLLLAQNLVHGMNFFILKEAPNTGSQVNYPGYDYSVNNRMISVPFSGFSAENSLSGWIKGYTVTTGVGNDEADNLFALRAYLRNSVIYEPETHEMIMMNTWGDRGQDGKISEKFILNELEGAKKLGITHFQIDDGWQEGLSANSVSESGKLWDRWSPEHWRPNKERFPNGFKKILRSAKEKNIRLGLWFHPTNDNNYASWKTDADIIISLYKTTGIRYFKIDGVKIPNKEAEINFSNFLSEVKRATRGEVFFNLDLTADVRGGYFMFRSAGNLFLENRYTDFVNYFPYHTLRNLWMLSKYFPPQLLQIEFLNKWRNSHKYQKGDPFAPINYDFDYLFAITMMAQPLAWMEASNLPDQAFEIAPLVKKYQSLMADIHKGAIMPVGSMPDGRSWTGFQSVQDQGGYLLVFREDTLKEKEELKLFLPEGQKVEVEKIFSSADVATLDITSAGKAAVSLSEKNAFALYRYRFVR